MIVLLLRYLRSEGGNELDISRMLFPRVLRVLLRLLLVRLTSLFNLRVRCLYTVIVGLLLLSQSLEPLLDLPTDPIVLLVRNLRVLRVNIGQRLKQRGAATQSVTRQFPRRLLTSGLFESLR